MSFDIDTILKKVALESDEKYIGWYKWHLSFGHPSFYKEGLRKLELDLKTKKLSEKFREKNMGWGCACTNKRACKFHIENSFYRGTDDYGTLPISYLKYKKIS